LKYFSFLRAIDRTARASFQAMLVDRFAPEFLAANPSLERFVVNVVDRTPTRLPYLPVTIPGKEGNADHAPTYDAILQIWLPSDEVFIKATKNLPDGSEANHRYAVSETVIWDREPTMVGKLPGIRYFGLIQFHDDLPESAIRRSWAHHIKLARRAHPNATQYHQNWIDRCLDLSAQPAGGISSLYFPTEQQAIEQFFDSDRGREEITHETQHFIKGGPRFYTTEYVFR
jgi:hypothetical protein